MGRHRRPPARRRLTGTRTAPSAGAVDLAAALEPVTTAPTSANRHSTDRHSTGAARDASPPVAPAPFPAFPPQPTAALDTTSSTDIAGNPVPRRARRRTNSGESAARTDGADPPRSGRAAERGTSEKASAARQEPVDRSHTNDSGRQLGRRITAVTAAALGLTFVFVDGLKLGNESSLAATGNGGIDLSLLADRDAGQRASRGEVRAVTQAPVPTDVEGLRAAADQARAELEQGNAQLEQGRARLAAAQAEAAKTAAHAAAATTEAKGAQAELGKIAAASYRAMDPNWALALDDESGDVLAAAGALSRLGEQQAELVTQLVTKLSEAKRAKTLADQAAATATAEAAALETAQQQLQARADEITVMLETALGKLEENRKAARIAEITAIPGCDPREGYADYPNGLVPEDALCQLPMEGELLRADAAVAFYQMNDAYIAEFGEPICITDSYRSLSSQRSLYSRKRSLAAVPGTSNHGWGLALDLCGGAEDYGTRTYEWLDARGDEYGWDNPDWARPGGSKREPWHWEFVPGVKQ